MHMHFYTKLQVRLYKRLEINTFHTDSSTGYEHLCPSYRRVMHMVIHSMVCLSRDAFLVLASYFAEICQRGELELSWDH